MDVDPDYSGAAYHSKLLSIEPKPGLSKCVKSSYVCDFFGHSDLKFVTNIRYLQHQCSCKNISGHTQRLNP